MSKQRKRKLFFTALAFMLPFLILYTVFTIWPVIQGFYVSMHKWGLMGKQKYIGFDNYIKFAGDKKFWSALGNTCKFVVITAPMLVIIALILALLGQPADSHEKRAADFLLSAQYPFRFRGILHCEEHLQSVQWTLKRRDFHSFISCRQITELQFLLDPKLVWVVVSVMTVWWTLVYHDALHIGLTGY